MDYVEMSPGPSRHRDNAMRLAATFMCSTCGISARGLRELVILPSCESETALNAMERDWVTWHDAVRNEGGDVGW